jgi:hypothetical protein
MSQLFLETPEQDKTAHERMCESSEWYTPPSIAHDAHIVMGGIDLDPASCETANRVICASQFYTKEQDGLALANKWNWRVFLNPPSPPGPWWKRLVEDHLAGLVTAAIYVAYSIEQLQQIQAWTPNAPLWDFPMCIPRKRVRYLQESEQLGLDGVRDLVPGAQPTHASAIIGIGVDRHLFRETFSRLGMCR